MPKYWEDNVNKRPAGRYDYETTHFNGFYEDVDGSLQMEVGSETLGRAPYPTNEGRNVISFYDAMCSQAASESE